MISVASSFEPSQTNDIKASQKNNIKASQKNNIKASQKNNIKSFKNAIKNINNSYINQPSTQNNVKIQRENTSPMLLSIQNSNQIYNKQLFHQHYAQPNKLSAYSTINSSKNHQSFTNAKAKITRSLDSKAMKELIFSDRQNKELFPNLIIEDAEAKNNFIEEMNIIEKAIQHHEKTFEQNPYSQLIFKSIIQPQRKQLTQCQFLYQQLKQKYQMLKFSEQTVKQQKQNLQKDNQRLNHIVEEQKKQIYSLIKENIRLESEKQLLENAENNMKQKLIILELLAGNPILSEVTKQSNSINNFNLINSFCINQSQIIENVLKQQKNKQKIRWKSCQKSEFSHSMINKLNKSYLTEKSDNLIEVQSKKVQFLELKLRKYDKLVHKLTEQLQLSISVNSQLNQINLAKKEIKAMEKQNNFLLPNINIYEVNQKKQQNDKKQKQKQIEIRRPLNFKQHCIESSKIKNNKINQDKLFKESILSNSNEEISSCGGEERYETVKKTDIIELKQLLNRV